MPEVVRRLRGRQYPRHLTADDVLGQERERGRRPTLLVDTGGAWVTIEDHKTWKNRFLRGRTFSWRP